MSFVRPLLCSCLALLACVPAAAQTQQQPSQTPRSQRPYRGIFASGVDDGGQSLTANGSVSGGYDDNILADATQRSNPFRQGQQGTLAQVSGSLNYSLSGARGDLEAGAGASSRYYPSLQNDYFNTYNARLDGQWLALTKPALTLHQGVGYQPFSFLSDLSASQPRDPQDLQLESLVAPDPDFVPIASQYIVYEGGADLDVRLTSRLDYTLGWDYHVADRTSHRFWRQAGNTGFHYALNRDVSLRVAYRYQEAHYTNRIVRIHSPDVGLDFHHALSLTRRTSLTFGVGTEATVVREQTRWRVTGNVNVLHEIGRSWTADGGYQRGTYFVDTLAEPVFGDTARAGLSGLISRRIQFDASANATLGDAGFNVQRKFNTYRGTVSLSTALNRHMNIGADYSYYRYKFDDGIELQDGLPRNVNRQSVRAHVSFWAPLMNKTRRRDATR